MPATATPGFGFDPSNITSRYIPNYGQAGEPSVSGLGTMGQSYTGLPYETFDSYTPGNYIYRPGQPY
jgi:hypothetical protein